VPDNALSDKTVDWGPVISRNRRTTVFFQGDQWLAASPRGFGEVAGITDPIGGGVALPGARDITIKELIGKHARRTKRYGEWVEIKREVADLNPDVLNWCRRFCNDESPAGTFRFTPANWDARCSDKLHLPFVPELDHESPTVRRLAAAERLRRRAAADLEAAQAKRDELIRQASAEGHSRRDLSRLLGVSFGRIQQVVRTSRT
jgi:hypothetical protein